MLKISVHSYIYLKFRIFESLGVNSLFANMTWEKYISFRCEMKVIIITISSFNKCRCANDTTLSRYI